MAKITTQMVVIKFSKLVKDDSPHQHIIPSDLGSSLEAVAQELAGGGVIVEVETVEHDGN